ncbi:hypothetical protein EJ110_NYTH30510 [Nymphaea thermarum]|nr:hypothetical protein EJ110_NYTH30510 [Nymphaea thermarum]
MPDVRDIAGQRLPTVFGQRQYGASDFWQDSELHTILRPMHASQVEEGGHDCRAWHSAVAEEVGRPCWPLPGGSQELSAMARNIHSACRTSFRGVDERTFVMHGGMARMKLQAKLVHRDLGWNIKVLSVVSERSRSTFETSGSEQEYIRAIKNLLVELGSKAKLLINALKSSFAPFNVNNRMLKTIRSSLGWQHKDFPVTHLGLPLFIGNVNESLGSSCVQETPFCMMDRVMRKTAFSSLWEDLKMIAMLGPIKDLNAMKLWLSISIETSCWLPPESDKV